MMNEVGRQSRISAVISRGVWSAAIYRRFSRGNSLPAIYPPVDEPFPFLQYLAPLAGTD
jgi:hypothetical protein